MVLAHWSDCEKYEMEIRGADIKNSKAVFTIVDREMNHLKLVFEKKMNALYAEYVKPFKSVQQIKLIRRTLDLNKKDYLDGIKYITLRAHEQLVGVVYADPITDAKDAEDHVESFCDEATKSLWIHMGEVDQKIKKELTEVGFPALNVIEMEVQIKVPTDLLIMINDAVLEATAGGAVENNDLWRNMGLKVAEMSMRKEEVRIKDELKSLRDEMFHRVEAITHSNPNKTIDMIFLKFKYEIRESYTMMNEIIVNDFSRPVFHHCDVIDEKDGILDCVRKSAEDAAKGLKIHANNVVKSAKMLNYVLELKDH